MSADTYTIFALIIRYILIIIVFYYSSNQESRKDNIYRGFTKVATLKIIEANETYALEQENIIGRSGRNDIIIKDRSVRRTHARLFLQSDEWIIEPYRKSRVMVNMVEADDKYAVNDDDELVIGELVCIFNQLDPLLEEGKDEED